MTDIKEFVDACADNVEEALSIYGDGMDIYDHIKDQLESVARDVVGATGAPGAKDEDDSRRAEEVRRVLARAEGGPHATGSWRACEPWLLGC